MYQQHGCVKRGGETRSPIKAMLGGLLVAALCLLGVTAAKAQSAYITCTGTGQGVTFFQPTGTQNGGMDTVTSKYDGWLQNGHYVLHMLPTVATCYIDIYDAVGHHFAYATTISMTPDKYVHAVSGPASGSNRCSGTHNSFADALGWMIGDDHHFNVGVNTYEATNFTIRYKVQDNCNALTGSFYAGTPERMAGSRLWNYNTGTEKWELYHAGTYEGTINALAP